MLILYIWGHSKIKKNKKTSKVTIHVVCPELPRCNSLKFTKSIFSLN